MIGSLQQYIIGPYDRFKYHEALKAMRQTYGPIVKENLGGKVIVHIFDPEDIKTVSPKYFVFQLHIMVIGWLPF
jgi:hypothetical protein